MGRKGAKRQRVNRKVNVEGNIGATVLLPCLSFSQPFTSLVLLGLKTIDSRWGRCLYDLFRREGETDVLVYCSFHDLSSLKEVAGNLSVGDLERLEGNIEETPRCALVGVVRVVDGFFVPEESPDAPALSRLCFCSVAGKYVAILGNPRWLVRPINTSPKGGGIWTQEISWDCMPAVDQTLQAKRLLVLAPPPKFPAIGEGPADHVGEESPCDRPIPVFTQGSANQVSLPDAVLVWRNGSAGTDRLQAAVQDIKALQPDCNSQQDMIAGCECVQSQPATSGSATAVKPFAAWVDDGECGSGRAPAVKPKSAEGRAGLHKIGCALDSQDQGHHLRKCMNLPPWVATLAQVCVPHRVSAPGMASQSCDNKNNKKHWLRVERACFSSPGLVFRYLGTTLFPIPLPSLGPSTDSPGNHENCCSNEDCCSSGWETGTQLEKMVKAVVDLMLGQSKKKSVKCRDPGPSSLPQSHPNLGSWVETGIFGCPQLKAMSEASSGVGLGQEVGTVSGTMHPPNPSPSPSPNPKLKRCGGVGCRKCVGAVSLAVSQLNEAVASLPPTHPQSWDSSQGLPSHGVFYQGSIEAQNAGESTAGNSGNKSTADQRGVRDGAGSGGMQEASLLDVNNLSNLVLVNLFLPNGGWQHYPPDRFTGLPHMAVGWHQDQMVVPHSPITVLSLAHTPGPDHSRIEEGVQGHEISTSRPSSALKLSSSKKSKTPCTLSGGGGHDWVVGFRGLWETSFSALQVKEGDTYCMSGGLNTTHQHAVFAPCNSPRKARVSFTHRRIREGSNRWEHMRGNMLWALRHLLGLTCHLDTGQDISYAIGPEENQPPPSFSQSSCNYPSARGISHRQLDRILSVVCGILDEAQSMWLEPFLEGGVTLAELHVHYWTPRLAALAVSWAVLKWQLMVVKASMGEGDPKSSDRLQQGSGSTTLAIAGKSAGGLGSGFVDLSSILGELLGTRNFEGGPFSDDVLSRSDLHQFELILRGT
ncbi:unnamed protein product [Discosporangium mesarthrocarpum]